VRPLIDNMRRIYVSWVMSLLLMLAQTGAVLHELGHLAHDSVPHGASLQSSEHLLESGPCPTCEAFAQIANPAAGAAAAAAIAPPPLIPIPALGCAIVSTDVPSPRSRGPPQV
jgi:hypothetical protein